MELMERAQRHLERMDIVVRASEIKWGVMVPGGAGLLGMVPPELAAKFNTQWDKLSDAITNSRHEDVIVLADGVVRGIWALERVVVLGGMEPSPLLSIGLGAAPAPTEKPSEYVPSGLPMDQEIPW